MKKKNVLERLMAKVRKNELSGCWNWTGYKDHSGYGQIHAKGRTMKTHRVSYEEHHGEIPKGMVVMHICDNPACCNPDHLTIGTRSANMLDAVRKGRLKVPALEGEEHPNSAFTDEEVVKLRKDYAAGRKLADIIASTHLARSTVTRMLWGKTYTHLPVFKRTDPYMNHRKSS